MVVKEIYIYGVKYIHIYGLKKILIYDCRRHSYLCSQINSLL